MLRYVSSSELGVAVMENWQLEYLQFTSFILLTVWLLQRGVARVEAATQGRARIGRGAEGWPARRPELAAQGPDEPDRADVL